MENIKRSNVKIPNYQIFEYSLIKHNHYQKTSPGVLIIESIPEILRLEKSRKPGIRKNVNYVITDLNKDGHRLFFTGLKPILKTTNHFIGDHVKYINNKRIVSITYFLFNDDFSGFMLFYFEGYTKHPKLISPFCRAFKIHLKNTGIID